MSGNRFGLSWGMMMFLANQHVSVWVNGEMPELELVEHFAGELKYLFLRSVGVFVNKALP